MVVFLMRTGWLINIPTLICCRELRKIMKSQIKGAEKSFLCGVTWLSIRDWTFRGSLEKRRCCFRHKRSRLRWFGHPIRCLLGASFWRASWNDQLGRDPRAEPEVTGRITYVIWPGIALGSPRSSWKVLLGTGMSGLPYLACNHRNPTPD